MPWLRVVGNLDAATCDQAMKVGDSTPEWIERARSYPPGMLDPRQALNALAVARTALQRIADTGRAPERVIARRALDTEVGET